MEALAKISYDPDEDVLYIRLREGVEHDVIEDDDAEVHVDENRMVLAVEIWNASKNGLSKVREFRMHQEMLILVRAHIIRSSESYSSERTQQGVRELFSRVNEIWSQANIRFELKDVISTDISGSILADICASIRDEVKAQVKARKPNNLVSLGSYDQVAINVFFVKQIGDEINAYAFVEEKIVLVVDEPTVNDFRATAHELGHVLGLEHDRKPGDQLTARGTNGTLLTSEEIRICREKAAQLFR